MNKYALVCAMFLIGGCVSVPQDPHAPPAAIVEASNKIMNFYEAPSPQVFAEIIAVKDASVQWAKENAPHGGADSIERSSRVFISFVWKKHGYSGSPYSENAMNDTVTYIQELKVTDPGELDALWAAYFATGDEQYLDKLAKAADSRNTCIAGAAKWSLDANYHQRKSVRQYFNQRPEKKKKIIK